MSTALSEYIPVYSGCRYCLMCRHVCPVGRTTRLESNTPHGWALLIASVERGQTAWNAETTDTLYACAQCGLCYANCITERPLPLAIAAARADAYAAGAAPAAVHDVEERLRRWGNPYVPHLPETAMGVAPTALFVGAAQHLSPNSVAAAQRLMQALGVDFVPVAVGLSSPSLPFALGLRETAASLAQSALREVAAAGSRRIVTLTPEDARAFTETLPELGLQLPEGVEVVELMALLAEAVDAGRLAFRRLDTAVTYHDPAYTPQSPGRAALARRVLMALLGQPVREMFWRDGRAAPGGAVGGLPFTHPQLAARMTRERLEAAAATGAELLVTEDPAALAHFAANMNGAGIRIESLYELLVQHLA